MSSAIDFNISIPTSYILGCLPEWVTPPEEASGEGGDFADTYEDHIKGDLSSKSPDELAAMINSWTGSAEDLVLMVMIAVSKDMDEKIRAKAKEVFNLRKKAEAEGEDGDKSTEALDQATQELQQMTKQRDQFFQMMQKILESLTRSTDNVLQSWK